MNSLLCQISLNSSLFILNNIYKGSVSKKHECTEIVCMHLSGWLCTHTSWFWKLITGGKSKFHTELKVPKTKMRRWLVEATLIHGSRRCGCLFTSWEPEWQCEMSRTASLVFCCIYMVLSWIYSTNVCSFHVYIEIMVSEDFSWCFSPKKLRINLFS